MGLTAIDELPFTEASGAQVWSAARVASDCGSSQDGKRLPTSVEALLRQLLIGQASRQSATDCIDCAELLHGLGLTDFARTCLKAGFLWMGFSRVQVERQALAAPWAGLAAAEQGVAPAPRLAKDASTLALAVADLRRLMRQVPCAPLPDRLPATLCDGSTARGGSPRALAAVRPKRSLDDLARLCEALYDGLSLPAAGSDASGSDDLLTILHDELLSQDGPPAAAPMDGPLAAHVAFFSVSNTRRFLFANYDLAYGPHGSWRLLHEAARLDPAGLGPYLTNVPRLLRSAADLFELLQLADAECPGGADGATSTGWLVALSQHTHGPILRDLLDRLTAQGDLVAARRILARLERRHDCGQDVGLLRRTRDAALDQGDFDLALRVQARVTSLRPDDADERSMLDDIRVSAGRFAEPAASSPIGLLSDPPPGLGPLVAS